MSDVKTLSQDEKAYLERFFSLSNQIRKTMLWFLRRGKLWPCLHFGLRYISDKLGRCIRTIRYHVTLLKQLGLIFVSRSGCMENNEYFIPKTLLNLFKSGYLKHKNCRSHCRSLQLEPQYNKSTVNKTYAGDVSDHRSGFQIGPKSYLYGKPLSKYKAMPDEQKRAVQTMIDVIDQYDPSKPFNPVIAVKLTSQYGAQRVMDAVHTLRSKMSRVTDIKRGASGYLVMLITSTLQLETPTYRENRSYWRSIKHVLGKIPFIEYVTGIQLTDHIEASFYMSPDTFQDQIMAAVESQG